MFQKLTEHIFVRPAEPYTDRPNIGLIRGENRTLLFDAGNSAANVEKLKGELTAGGLPLPDLVAVSHWHWDHSFGMAAWGVSTIAGRDTDRQLRRMGSWKWDDEAMAERVRRREDIAFCSEMIKREYPDRSKINVTPADIVFDGCLTVELGGVTCELIHARGPHSLDSVICYVPEDRFLLLGDSDCKNLYGIPWHFDIEHEENFGPATDAIPYDRELVEEFLRLLDTLDFTRCVNGHGEPMTREELYQKLEE